MQMPTHASELEARYVAVFQGLRENRAAAGETASALGLIRGRRRLNDCLQRLDGYAEHLHQLDEDLGRMTDLRETDTHEYTERLSRYSELLELGARVYSTLYREYKDIRKRRETLNFVSLATAVSGIAAAGFLFLLL